MSKKARPFGAGPRNLPKVRLEQKFMRIERAFETFRDLTLAHDYGQAEHVLRKIKANFEQLFPLLMEVEKSATEFKQHKHKGETHE